MYYKYSGIHLFYPTTNANLDVPLTPQTSAPHIPGAVDARVLPPGYSVHMGGRDARGYNRFTQPSVRHYSRHTPTAPTRRRGYNRGKRSGRGQGSSNCYDSYYYGSEHPRDQYNHYRGASPAYHREYSNAQH